MECEENLQTEQIKCREVVKARCEPLESELKLLKHNDHARQQAAKDKDEKLVSVEREI